MDPQTLKTAVEYGLSTFILFALASPAIAYLVKKIFSVYEARLEDHKTIIGVADASKATLQGLNANLDQRARMWEMTAEAQRVSAEAQKSLASTLDRMREQAERTNSTCEVLRQKVEDNTRKLDELLQQRP